MKLTPRMISLLVAASLACAAPSWAAVKKTRKEAQKEAIAKKQAPLPEADEAQLEASKRALIGRYVCEFGQEILLDRNDSNPGYLNLKYKSQLWIMKPVLSSTGALRIEDTRGQALLLQIAFKSMLMNTKTGQRLVDNCVHETQRAAEEEARQHPPAPSLIN